MGNNKVWMDIGFSEVYGIVSLIVSTFMFIFAHKCGNVFYGKESV